MAGQPCWGELWYGVFNDLDVEVSPCQIGDARNEMDMVSTSLLERAQLRGTYSGSYRIEERYCIEERKHILH